MGVPAVAVRIQAQVGGNAAMVGEPGLQKVVLVGLGGQKGGGEDPDGDQDGWKGDGCSSTGAVTNGVPK